jgi:hypothetical protein
MRACCKLLDDLLMAAMDAIKDANRQPGILQVNFIERMVMSHIRAKRLDRFFTEPGSTGITFHTDYC